MKFRKLVPTVTKARTHRNERVFRMMIASNSVIIGQQ